MRAGERADDTLKLRVARVAEVHRRLRPDEKTVSRLSFLHHVKQILARSIEDDVQAVLTHCRSFNVTHGHVGLDIATNHVAG